MAGWVLLLALPGLVSFVPLSRVGRPGAARSRVLATDDEPAEGLLSPQDLAALRARMDEVKRGDKDAPTELYRLMTKDEPPEMIVDFLRSSSPMVIEAMQGALISLLGGLPPQFNMQIKSTVDKLAALSFQLQMTGYMFRNAEYVLSLREALRLGQNSTAEVRAAFDALDRDGSGTLDAAEATRLLERIKGGAVYINGTRVSGGVSTGDVREFLDVFDTDGDAKVSWDEFVRIIRAVDPPAQVPQIPEAPGPDPAVRGKIKLRMDSGEEIFVDAERYVDDLRDRVAAMRGELARIEATKAEEARAAQASIATYLESLAPEEVKGLSANVSPEVVEAMKLLVDSVVESMGGDRAAEVVISRQMLGQICMWQLITGYKLRVAEAQGEVDERRGL